MGVHNIAEYVAYHQQKLREQNQRQQASTSSAPSTPQPQKKPTVNTIRSQDSFKTSVTSDKSGQLIVLDMFATWCGPCKVIAPVVEKYSEEFSNAKFYKIDVDNSPAIAQELGIRAMPTFVLFKDGEKVAEIVGADKNKLREAIEKNY